MVAGLGMGRIWNCLTYNCIMKCCVDLGMPEEFFCLLYGHAFSIVIGNQQVRKWMEGEVVNNV